MVELERHARMTLGATAGICSEGLPLDQLDIVRTRTFAPAREGRAMALWLAVVSHGQHSHQIVGLSTSPEIGDSWALLWLHFATLVRGQRKDVPVVTSSEYGVAIAGWTEASDGRKVNLVSGDSRTEIDAVQDGTFIAWIPERLPIRNDTRLEIAARRGSGAYVFPLRTSTEFVRSD